MKMTNEKAPLNSAAHRWHAGAASSLSCALLNIAHSSPARSSHSALLSARLLCAAQTSYRTILPLSAQQNWCAEAWLVCSYGVSKTKEWRRKRSANRAGWRISIGASAWQ